MSSITMAADSTQSELKEHLKGKKHKKKEGTKKKKKDTKKRRTDHDSDSDCNSDLDLKRDLRPIGGYLRDRELTVNQMFRTIRGNKLKAMLPEILKPIPVDELKKLCIEQLDCMSRKRIRRILQGADPETISSSGTEEDSSLSDSDKPKRVSSDEDIQSNNVVDSTSPKEDNSQVAPQSDASRSPQSYASRSRSPLCRSSQSKVTSPRSSCNSQTAFSESQAAFSESDSYNDEFDEGSDTEIVEEVVYEEIVLEDGEDLESILGHGSYMKGTKDSRLRTITAHEAEVGEDDDVMVIEREEREEQAEVIMVEDEEEENGLSTAGTNNVGPVAARDSPVEGGIASTTHAPVAQKSTVDKDTPLTEDKMSDVKVSGNSASNVCGELSMKKSNKYHSSGMNAADSEVKGNTTQTTTNEQTDLTNVNEDGSKDQEMEKQDLEMEVESTASPDVMVRAGADETLVNTEVADDPVMGDKNESDKEVTSTVNSVGVVHMTLSQHNTDVAVEDPGKVDNTQAAGHSPSRENTAGGSVADGEIELVLEPQNDSILDMEKDDSVSNLEKYDSDNEKTETDSKTDAAEEDKLKIDSKSTEESHSVDENLINDSKVPIKVQASTDVESVQESVDDDEQSSKKRQREDELEEGELEDSTSDEEPEEIEEIVHESDFDLQRIATQVDKINRRISEDAKIKRETKKRKIKVIKRIIKVIRRNPSSGQAALESLSRETTAKLKASCGIKHGTMKIPHHYMKVKIKKEPGLSESMASTSLEQKDQSKSSKSRSSSEVKQEHRSPKVKHQGHSGTEDSSLNKMEILELEMRARAIKAMLKKQELIDKANKPEVKKKRLKLKR